MTPDVVRLKIFISYSRRDMAFADRLADSMGQRGLDVRIDRRDLPKLEDWRRELTDFIRKSDTTVLIVSPNSLASPVVAWEVEQVTLHGKRLAPVVIADISSLAVPPDIARINYADFRDPQRFEADADELAKALKTDIAWLKEHTRLGELATRWIESGKPEDGLLRGGELVHAERWTERRPSEMPAVTETQHAFFFASRESEGLRAAREVQQRHRRRQLAAAALVVASAAACYVAWSNRPYLREQLAELTDRLQQSRLSPATERALKPGSIFSDCRDCPQMMVVPAGSFMMGSPDSDPDRRVEETPYHPVTIARQFGISVTEVTFAQWDTCHALGGCSADPSDLGFGRDARPVLNIDLRDAQEYVLWLKARTHQPYRLLSEAEWEYAARAGSVTRYPWNDAIGQNNADCAECGSSFDNRSTAPVRSFTPNGFGLYDMIGNVWEWVEDCWHDTYNGAPADGSAWTTTCSEPADSVGVVRGGSWDDKSTDLRTASRYSPGITAQTRVNGIRVGRDLQK
jgi:formylglycine-generating enzyme required for sulfatase activity